LNNIKIDTMATELSEKEIEAVLTNNSVGHLGCTDGENVYIVPVNYRYDNHTVMCYSLVGLKIEMMRKHSTVCFEVEEIKDADYWKCVIINGVFEEIKDEEELKGLRPHYTEYLLRKHATLQAITQPAGHEAADQPLNDAAQVLYRIRFTRVTGRFEHGFMS